MTQKERPVSRRRTWAVALVVLAVILLVLLGGLAAQRLHARAAETWQSLYTEAYDELCAMSSGEPVCALADLGGDGVPELIVYLLPGESAYQAAILTVEDGALLWCSDVTEETLQAAYPALTEIAPICEDPLPLYSAVPGDGETGTFQQVQDTETGTTCYLLWEAVTAADVDSTQQLYTFSQSQNGSLTASPVGDPFGYEDNFSHDLEAARCFIGDETVSAQDYEAHCTSLTQRFTRLSTVPSTWDASLEELLEQWSA